MPPKDVIKHGETEATPVDAAYHLVPIGFQDGGCPPSGGGLTGAGTWAEIKPQLTSRAAIDPRIPLLIKNSDLACLTISIKPGRTVIRSDNACLSSFIGIFGNRHEGA